MHPPASCERRPHNASSLHPSCTHDLSSHPPPWLSSRSARTTGGQAMTAPHHRLSCVAVMPLHRLPPRFRCQLVDEGIAHVPSRAPDLPIHSHRCSACGGSRTGTSPCWTRCADGVGHKRAVHSATNAIQHDPRFLGDDVDHQAGPGRRSAPTGPPSGGRASLMRPAPKVEFWSSRGQTALFISPFKKIYGEI